MEDKLLVAVIGVSSALAGTLLGGLISYFSNKNLKDREWKLSIIREEINELKKLYSDYLSEATRLEVASLKNKVNDLREFNVLGTILSQIELLGSQNVIKAARELGDHVLHSHVENIEKREKGFFDHKCNYVAAVKKELLELKVHRELLDSDSTRNV